MTDDKGPAKYIDSFAPQRAQSGVPQTTPGPSLIDQFLQEFANYQKLQFELVRAKNNDYAGHSRYDPFANLTMVETMGIVSTELGFLTRMSDKFSRVTTFVKKRELQVKTESVQDTLMDLATYSILMAIYLDRKNKRELSSGAVGSST